MPQIPVERGTTASVRRGVATPETEIRVVSVLFLDLVGFTDLAEGQDPERVRELLDRYFSRARRVVERYGGTVEKFIGDAVMAVWGTPVTHDDDAERAVRAALELVDDVAALGQTEAVSDLRARAGITTGRVAVTLGAEQQGMVAGDRVNTAARLQTAAAPGAVLVDGTTRRATSTAIAYDEMGPQELKGKDEVVTAWRAQRVVARRGGAVGAQGLEPPFVGRTREFRLVREVFETVAEQGTAALVSVVGQGGIGKSRLAWEFEKHLDGLVESVYWHRGRCLAYGEGVAYAALAEMVRERADIVEDEAHSTARTKLENVVAAHIEDPDERALVIPRLAQLLGLDETGAPDQSALFAGWRLFFERLADRYPVVLVFEDIQWADRGLLEFLEHLLDWARDRRILVLALGRPEVLERIDWTSRIRNLTSIHLEPLTDDAMRDLLAGLVPGLPDELRSRIAERAEGVPLYAVETVRMLLDRGQILPGEAGYELADEVDELAVPETLQTLVAARLDGLEPEIRDLAQHAAVLGQSFTADGVAALSGLDQAAVDEGLRTLRARDIVGVDPGTRGRDTGRYTFLQTLLRTVAYDTLSRHERRRRHLAAARHLESSTGSDELAEVIATHFLDAYRADPEAEDAHAVRSDALRMLRRAADRAESLAALDEARRCCEVAVELTDEPRSRAEALLRAGDLAFRSGGETEIATEHLQAANAIFAQLDDVRGQALADAGLARMAFEEGRGPEAVERLEAALEHLDAETSPLQYGQLAAELARILYFLGRVEDAARYVEAALPAAEAERDLGTICETLNTKALVLWNQGQPEEALALMRHAYLLSESDQVSAHSNYRAANNMTVLLGWRARWDEYRRVAETTLRRARRVGDRKAELGMLTKLANVAEITGSWDEAAGYLDEAEATGRIDRMTQGFLNTSRGFYLLRTGDLDAARELLDEMDSAGIADEQERLMSGLIRMMLLNRSGDHRAAVDVALALTDSPTTQASLAARVEDGIASALEIGDIDAAEELRRRSAAFAEPADAQAAAALALSDARIAAAHGAETAEELFRAAVSAYEEIGMPHERAVAELELAEVMLAAGSADEARRLLEEAEETLTQLGARNELDRLDDIRSGHALLATAERGTVASS